MIVTYLGHQGWSFNSDAGHVFLDPVFRNIGNAGVQLPIWPDREVDVEMLGPIAGLVLSHEHSDHFDIDTLLRMPWRGEVFISDRSSEAMSRLLEDLGYLVVRKGAYDVVSFPGVRITFLPLTWSLLEPDAYGFLVEADDGSTFFTGVDGMPHAETVKWLAKHHPNRTVDNFTNNYLEPLPELTGFDGHDQYATGVMAANMIAGVQQLTPDRVVMSGQGWSYPPKYSELNHRFFNVTHAEMLPILQATYPHIRWQAPPPGTYLCLSGEPEDGEIAPYIKSRETTQRDYKGYTDAMAGEPWSRVRNLDTESMSLVRNFVVTEFGQQISAFGHRLLERLFVLSTQPQNTLMPTIALRLKNGDSNEHFILDAGWLRFVAADPGVDIRNEVAAGVEVWASDLLLLIRGQEEPYLVYETAVRRWCNEPQLIGSTVHVHVFLPFGPRNQPEQYYQSYRKRLLELEATHDEVKELQQAVPAVEEMGGRP